MYFSRILIFCFMVCCAWYETEAEEKIIKNGSFETFSSDYVPDGWIVPPAAEARFSNSVEASDGRWGLSVSRRGKSAPKSAANRMFQMIRLYPAQKYRLQFQAKGREPQALYWAFGADHSLRVPIRNVTDQWQTFAAIVQLPATELRHDGICEFSLVCENECELTIDNVTLTPINNDATGHSENTIVITPIAVPGRSRNLVRNGTFEGTRGRTIPEWNWFSCRAQFVAELDGRGKLHVWNNSSWGGDTYGSLSQGIPLKPGKSYRLNLRAKGHGTPPEIRLGNSWKTRIPFDFLSSDWRDYSLSFRTPDSFLPGDYDKENRIPLLFISNAVTDFWLDSIEVVTEENLERFAEEIQVMQTFLQELELINEKVDDFYGSRPRSEYITAPLEILNHHLPLLTERLLNATLEDEKNFYAKTVQMIQPEIKETLAELNQSLSLLQSGKRLPEVLKYRSSPVRPVDGWPEALVENEQGKRQIRPIVSIGYGHFSQIYSDIEKFKKIGVNTVQVEVCPWVEFPREGKAHEFEPNFERFDKEFMPFLQKAWENDIQIVLLLSPHSFPSWLSEKYPSILFKNRGIDWDNPKMTEMMFCHIRAVLQRIQASPYANAIHSICLTNEPVYRAWTPENSSAVQRFVSAMTGKYGPVDQFNARAKRNYTSYEALTAAAQSDSAAKYEFYTEGRNAFAHWHRQAADAVKQIWPGMPVHAKGMAFNSPYHYEHNLSTEKFAQFSDYNGNDNYFLYQFQNDQVNNALADEIQISAKPVSIANTENHILPDSELRAIPRAHVYTAVFQQYVFGTSTIITWVYQDCDYALRVRHSFDFAACIYQRPGCLAAHAKAALDGMRLAPELQKFMKSRSEVALLSSETSAILDGNYEGSLVNWYEMLSLTGYRARTLSEQQLADGKFEGVKILFVPQVLYISEAALAGMSRFVKQGGQVVSTGWTLRENQYGNPILPDFPILRLDDFHNPHLLTSLIHKSGVAPLPLQLVATNEGAAVDVFFRMVPAGDGSWLVNIVNYKSVPCFVDLKGVGFLYDLIEEKNMAFQFELPPLKPLLLRFTPKK